MSVCVNTLIKHLQEPASGLSPASVIIFDTELKFDASRLAQILNLRLNDTQLKGDNDLGNIDDQVDRLLNSVKVCQFECINI